MLRTGWESIDISLVSISLSYRLYHGGSSGRELDADSDPLTGLRKLLQNGEVAELLSDPLVARSGTWNMSTSQIYIRHSPAYGTHISLFFDSQSILIIRDLAGWGPVATDGYGIPYMIHEESLQFTVTCADHMPGAKFIANLEKAADLLMDMMVSAESESKL